MTKYIKVMFLSFWNRTNNSVTAHNSASNLNAPEDYIPIKRLKNNGIRHYAK